MADNLQTTVTDICKMFENDRTRMMDIVKAVQSKLGRVSGEAMEIIAKTVSSQRVEVESVVSFYSFFSKERKGKIVIRLCNDAIDRLNGMEEVAKTLSKELGIEFGQTSADGRFTLEYTPCIGMCDQAPAALVNDVVVTRLTGSKAHELVQELRCHNDPNKLVREFGDGNNSHELIKSMVVNNIREKGAAILADHEPGAGLHNALRISPNEVIRAVKTARLRGRGGAGFPTGMKWEFARAAEGERKVIMCNADEGEPGTFKDRVILTEKPELVFEGMAIAGYAIGADSGILYLRGEYAYLRPWLEQSLKDLRSKNILGKSVGGKAGFDFDIRIQMGAGAYVCGEETALISSCEGLRGDPKTRPPFPAQKGYLGRPTAVNNVETLCCVTKILDKGAPWFGALGCEDSSGTKLLSVSGDCRRPGVYEVPFGLTVRELLTKVGAENTLAVQVGGPSGTMIAERDFGRRISYQDLATGGAILIFGTHRNPARIAEAFMDFFVEESCGYCTPCRVGNVLLKERLQRILAGKGVPSDLDYLLELGRTIKTMSRCGLGQTSPNPVLNSIGEFRSHYEALLVKEPGSLQPAFDLTAALAEAEEIAGLTSAHC